MKKVILSFILVLIAILVTYSAWLVRPSQYQQKPSQTYESYQSAERLVNLPPKEQTSNNTTEKYTKKEIEQWAASRSDLAAQWNMADTAFIGLCVGGLGLLFIAWTLIETRSAAKSAALTLVAANKATVAANANNEIMRYDQRPWIKIISVYGNLTQSDNSVLFVGKIKVANTGNTPALIAACRSSFFAMRHDTGSIPKEGRELFKSFGYHTSSETIFPKEEHEFTIICKCEPVHQNFTYTVSDGPVDMHLPAYILATGVGYRSRQKSSEFSYTWGHYYFDVPTGTALPTVEQSMSLSCIKTGPLKIK